MRLTHGVLSTEGSDVIPPVGIFTMFDAPEFLDRDASQFSTFAQTWYGNSPLLKLVTKASQRRPRSHDNHYLMDYQPIGNSAQTEVIATFVHELEERLGIKRMEISLTEE
ncbi:uncharacterized protein BDR25DRAFT_360557 [Lindgomyces ingoldianus]|uniref:Uncharacterized protein n=1 Tax=Lindgomyces ingoldianus TaxID=673940 RepID=A0ACB6QF79_9PLEO|nr:uncharacterized protein BDR25DRAFT_360557 [Lindgomyces ingoldianus]KAF2465618.1 hypothetical protein BDR25DRAFT_360557 [Lindgomyces ingoldianus]